jgi:hypothetical protein
MGDEQTIPADALTDANEYRRALCASLVVDLASHGALPGLKKPFDLIKWCNALDDFIGGFEPPEGDGEPVAEGEQRPVATKVTPLRKVANG